MQIGLAIRRARELAGYSQDGLAYLVKCPRSYIAKVETGRAMPRIEQIQRIAIALGTTASMIVRDAECFVPIQMQHSAVNTAAPLQ